MLAPPDLGQKPTWQDVAPGISCKLLATDADKSRVSMLVRLAPRTDYPPHRHAGLEELYLLHGELTINEKRIYPGYYYRAMAGTEDHRAGVKRGAVVFCLRRPRTSFYKLLLVILLEFETPGDLRRV